MKNQPNYMDLLDYLCDRIASISGDRHSCSTISAESAIAMSDHIKVADLGNHLYEYDLFHYSTCVLGGQFPWVESSRIEHPFMNGRPMASQRRS